MRADPVNGQTFATLQFPVGTRSASPCLFFAGADWIYMQLWQSISRPGVTSAVTDKSLESLPCSQPRHSETSGRMRPKRSGPEGERSLGRPEIQSPMRVRGDIRAARR